MEQRELSIKLRSDARRLGLCDLWFGQWKDETSMEELVSMYVKGLDFCIKHRWPSKDFIKHNFPKDFLRSKGILVDDKHSYPVRDENRRQVYLMNYVLLGESCATIRYSFRPHLCNIWVCNNSSVKVDLKYGAYALVHLFDNSSADITTDLTCTATVIRHSPSAKITKNGNINVKNEFHYLE